MTSLGEQMNATSMLEKQPSERMTLMPKVEELPGEQTIVMVEERPSEQMIAKSRPKLEEHSSPGYCGFAGTTMPHPEQQRSTRDVVEHGRKWWLRTTSGGSTR